MVNGHFRDTDSWTDCAANSQLLRASCKTPRSSLHPAPRMVVVTISVQHRSVAALQIRLFEVATCGSGLQTWAAVEVVSVRGVRSAVRPRSLLVSDMLLQDRRWRTTARPTEFCLLVLDGSFILREVRTYVFAQTLGSISVCIAGRGGTARLRSTRGGPSDGCGGSGSTARRRLVASRPIYPLAPPSEPLHLLP